MNHRKCATRNAKPNSRAAEMAGGADAQKTGACAFPPAPITDNGQLRLGAQSPLFGASEAAIKLGAQSPLFLANLVSDAGLVRLGAQSPTF